MASNAAIALIAVTLATFINSLGFILMKLALIQCETDKSIPFIKRWKYIAGLSCLILGAIVAVGSLAFGDIITLSSTSSLTIVFNSILSTKILKEVFTKYDLYSIVLIIIGASLCVFFSNYKSVTLDSDELMNLYLSVYSIIFILGSIVFSLVALKIGSKIIKKLDSFQEEAKQQGLVFQDITEEEDLNEQLIPQEQRTRASERQNIIDKENDDQLTNAEIQDDQQIDKSDNPYLRSANAATNKSHQKDEFDKENTPTRIMIQFLMHLTEKQIREINPNLKKYYIRVPLLLFPWASGLLSSLTTTFIKGVSEQLTNYDIVYNLSHGIVYILLITVVGTLFSQLYFMNNTLKYYNQLELIPIYQSAVIINNLLCGGIIFQEFRQYEWWQLLIVVLGTCICVCGILVILKKYQLISQHHKYRLGKAKEETNSDGAVKVLQEDLEQVHTSSLIN